MMDPVFVYELIDPSGESLEWLESEGVEVVRGHSMLDHPPRRYSQQEFIAIAKDYRAVMGSGGQRFTKDVFEQLPKLAYISKLGIGVDNVDLEEARHRHIQVTNTPNPTDFEAVAEHTLALMLGLKKQLRFWTPEFMRHGGWRSGLMYGELLVGKTIGLIGFGRVGRAVARRLEGWSLEVCAYDPGVSQSYHDVELVELEELLRRSDVVSVHAVATPENRHLLNRSSFEMMKSSSIVINTARGSLIALDDLHAALQEGEISGAGLDVYEQEPPLPDHPIFNLPNVLTTPHSAGWSYDGLRDIGWTGARNMLAMLRGEVPEYRVA